MKSCIVANLTITGPCRFIICFGWYFRIGFESIGAFVCAGEKLEIFSYSGRSVPSFRHKVEEYEIIIAQLWEFVKYQKFVFKIFVD